MYPLDYMCRSTPCNVKQTLDKQDACLPPPIAKPVGAARG